MSAPDWLSPTIRAAAKELTFEAGQYIFRSGARTTGLYEIIQGKIRLVRVDRSGREAILQVAGAGDTFAEASLFSSSYHCDAIASTDTTLRLSRKG